jgi:hypothetical protein
MERKDIKSFKEYLEIIDELTDAKHEILLFRGQSDNSPLLPSIARKDPKKDTTNIEKEMLQELRRRTQLTIKTPLSDSWELLIYAQHFGMKTRLLDWTSNPLTALWFACSNEYKLTTDSYVYIFTADSSFLINVKSKETPFATSKTRILRPSLNNERIIAQAGWFTAHKYSKSAKCFVKLETNTDLRDKLIQIKIPSRLKIEMLQRLSIFGINSETLFPDITGVCNHLNWMYTNK